jgi:hypothetical protein
MKDGFGDRIQDSIDDTVHCVFGMITLEICHSLMQDHVALHVDKSTNRTLSPAKCTMSTR